MAQKGNQTASRHLGINKIRKKDRNCFLCERRRHFAEKCWYMLSHESGRRGQNRGRDRGRRIFHSTSVNQNVNGFGNSRIYCQESSLRMDPAPYPDEQPPRAQNYFDGNLRSNINTQVFSPQDNMARIGLEFGGGFMVRINLGATVAQLYESKYRTKSLKTPIYP